MRIELEELFFATYARTLTKDQLQIVNQVMGLVSTSINFEEFVYKVTVTKIGMTTLHQKGVLVRVEDGTLTLLTVGGGSYFLYVHEK